MSIVSETYAVCEGCGHRVIADEYPDAWTIVRANGSERAFCSAACLLVNVSAAALPKPQRMLALGLTESDVKYLELVALGKTNKEIAVELGKREQTVKNRLSEVFSKLGVFDRTQAILRAHAAGIINVHSLAQRFSDAALQRAA